LQFDESIQIRKQIVRECERVNRDKLNDRFWFFMKNTNVLIILQYNVRNEKIHTMISLFVDKNIQNYDVIAIQKFWRNSFASISLSIMSQAAIQKQDCGITWCDYSHVMWLRWLCTERNNFDSNILNIYRGLFILK
jgi:hypothetical protein